MTTTKRGRAPSAADAAAVAAPSLPADKEANGKHLSVKKKDGRRDSNGNGEANVANGLTEPPLPEGTKEPTLSPSSAPFWAAVERDALAALVAPEPVERFLSETWERRPAVFRATEERRALVGERGELFTKRAFDAVVAAAAAGAAAGAKKGAAEAEVEPSSPLPPPAPPVLFGRDVCASRYRRGARENLGGAFGAPVTPAALWRLYGSEEGEEKEDDDDSSSSPSSPPRRRPSSSSSSFKATLQVHQPQRWCDASWRLVAALEARLGCLVGANSYMTPAGSRGLAPHWDDVEVFVLQVEGAKAWRVCGWGGKKGEGSKGSKGKGKGVGAPLASAPSGDLDERSLGQPALEVVLLPGDVLYLPRGTVHAAAADVVMREGEEGGKSEEESGGGEEAKARKKRRRDDAKKPSSSSAAVASASNHLTLSSHQRWSLCDLALAAISAAAAVPPSCDDDGEEKARGGLPASLRPGLHPGFLQSAGFERGALAAVAGARASSAPPPPPPPPLATAAALAKGLRDLAEALEKSQKSSSSSSLRLLDGAADALSADFFASRLPPHPSQLLAGGAGSRAPRGAADSVAVRGKGLFRLVACDPGAGCCGGDGEGGGEENGGGGGFVRILSCVRNERAAHLVPPLPSSSSSRPRSQSPSSSSFSSSDDDEGSSGSGGGGGGGGSKQVSAEDDEGEEEGEEESDDDEEEDEDEDEDEEESEGDCSTLYPSSYAPALAQLLSSTPDRPLEVSRVALPSAEARLGLVYSLWSEGVLAVV